MWKIKRYIRRKRRIMRLFCRAIMKDLSAKSKRYFRRKRRIIRVYYKTTTKQTIYTNIKKTGVKIYDIIKYVIYIIRVDKQIRKFMNEKIMNYPTPTNLNYLWNFGSILLLCLVIQIVTGFVMAFWYVPSVDKAFYSVEHIMREVNYGWLFRYVHSNGASFFFAAVYIHMLRGIYYGSYITPRQKVWYSGCAIFILLMAIAFFGYILPWGQMSYWAATVITSLISAIPYIGEGLLSYLWGGYSVDQPTLSRIFSLHYILPFVLVGLVMVHIFFLHEVGSNNPLGSDNCDKISFYPYFVAKDLVGISVFMIIFSIVVFFMPNFLSHPDNYEMANPEVTPLHIVPEWYFLLFYGILRSVPSKIGGILLLIASIACIVFLPIISRPVIRSGRFRPLFKIAFWLFVADVIILSWTASNPVETPYFEIGQAATIFYFVFFLILNPVIIVLERRQCLKNDEQFRRTKN